MKRHASETTIGRITRNRTWDRRYRRTPQAIRSLPVGPPDTRIPPVRILNLYLAFVLLWFFIAAWFVSEVMS